MVEALAAPAVQQRLSGIGVDGEASTPEALATFLEAKREKWGRCNILARNPFATSWVTAGS